jgi:hypothetical protein
LELLEEEMAVMIGISGLFVFLDSLNGGFFLN